jgi:hypothetical protein
MTPFEYVTVLISIILGLGITQIVTGVADLVNQQERVKIYWPHLLWVVIIFVLHIQEWWATFELRQFDTWRLPTFLFVVLYPINLFILARLLFPLGLSNEVIDLKEFYYKNFKKIFGWSIILPLLSLITNVIIIGHSVQEEIVQLLLPIILLVMIRKKTQSEILHKIMAVLFLSMLIVSMIATWNSSLITK